MLSERVNLLMNALNASCADLARLTRRSASSFSRLRSGARVPPHTSPTIRFFAQGMYLLALETGQMDKLCALIHCESSSESIRTMIRWLFADETAMQLSEPENRMECFSKRLDMLMLLADMNNQSLALAANLDYSYVSRLHRGERFPKAGSDSLRLICDALYKKIRIENKLSALAKMTELEPDIINASIIRDWLCGFTESIDFVTARHFLKNIELISASQVRPLAAPSIPPSRIQQYYYGQEGICDAVTRFLSMIQPEQEIWVYSDYPIEWMSGAFRHHWISLARYCISLGVHVRIIHNVDKTIPELLSSILSWMPLYLTGRIEPYYSEKQCGDRFTHTLFVCPGHTAITGCAPVGGNCVFSFVTDPERLSVLKEEFELLMKNSRPLMTIQNHTIEPEGEALTKRFGHTEVIVNEDYVTVNKHAGEPGSYCFYHPSIINVFRSMMR